jgi:hypothetical protein
MSAVDLEQVLFERIDRGWLNVRLFAGVGVGRSADGRNPIAFPKLVGLRNNFLVGFPVTA